MRITGGTFRSRVLLAPRGRTTRPTSDRVREALFGILASAGAVEGASVVDLYAGTGALGLEALSRGAAHCAFVESGREALGVLRQNVTALGVAGKAKVIPGGVGTAAVLGALVAAGPFDVALVDPPWPLIDDGEVTPALASIVASGALREGALIVLERSSRTDRPSIPGCSGTEDRRYGDATLAFYKTGILARPRGDI
jgi:16S rRNA (guanine966-N2)-methyltransferase